MSNKIPYHYLKAICLYFFTLLLFFLVAMIIKGVIFFDLVRNSKPLLFFTTVIQLPIINYFASSLTLLKVPQLSLKKKTLFIIVLSSIACLFSFAKNELNYFSLHKQIQSNVSNNQSTKRALNELLIKQKIEYRKNEAFYFTVFLASGFLGIAYNHYSNKRKKYDGKLGSQK